MEDNPTYLYHYTDADTAINILKTSEFRLTKITSCNDPFEFDNLQWLVDLSNEKNHRYYCNKMMQFYREGHPFFPYEKEIILSTADAFYKKNIKNMVDNPKKGLPPGCLPIHGSNISIEFWRNSAYIACFSAADVRSNILWSHYGKKHTGAALEFKFPQEFYGNKLLKIRHDQKNKRAGILTPREVVEFFEHAKDDRAAGKLLVDKIICTKHSNWEYEKEWRCIIMADPNVPPDAPPAILNIRNSISAIYAGVNFDRKKLANLKNWIKENFNYIKIFSAEKDSRDIKLKFNLLEG